MGDDITIGVTEITNLIEVTSQPNDQIIDIAVTDNTDNVTVNVTPSVVEINIIKGTGSGSSAVTSVNGYIGDVVLTKTDLGLGNVDNTSDLDKPISTATQSALDLKVPYTGATSNVNLGEFQLSTGQITFDQTPTQSSGIGVMRWNDTDGTLDLGLKGGNVTLQLGQEQVVRIVNKTASNLTEAGYQAVYTSGAQGQRLKVDLALANSDLTSSGTLGIVTENIAVNQEGFVTTNGLVRGVNTTGSLQGETWVDGDILYLSPTIAGRITNIKPIAPQHLVVIGVCVYAHITQGSIFVKVDNGYELEELHNVLITSVANNDILVYETASTLWKNKSISTALGYTPASSAITISTTAPLSGGGNLSANRTLSISQSNTTTNGYLSSIDWNTFNGKQAALSGTGFVKSTAGVISYDTNTYLTTAVTTLSGGTTGLTPSSATSGAITLAGTLVVGNGGTGSTTASGARTNLGATTVGSNVFTSTNPTAITFLRANADNTVSWLDATTFRAAIGAGTSSTVGTVTSVSALTLGTTGTDLSSTVANGTTTPVITLNVPTSSAINRGVLSSADWTTFNNKQNALTNPITGTGITNYLPKFTGASTLGNSLIFDNGSQMGIGTAIPNTRLGISWNASATSLIDLINTSATGQSGIDYYNSTGINVGYIGTFNSHAEMSIQSLSASGNLTFRTNALERMRIASSGNILIGTTTDDGINKLQVSGYSIATGYRTPSGLSTEYLKADGTVSTLTNPVTGTGAGTTNYLPKFTGVNALGNSAISCFIFFISNSIALTS